LSCKKNVVKTNLKEQTAVSTRNAKVEKMSRFLSITLNVSKESIVYNPELKEFVVLNKLKFNYSSVETNYDIANEYKLNHEKN